MRNLMKLTILGCFVLLFVSLQAQVTVSIADPIDGQDFTTAPHDLYVLVNTTGRVRKVSLYLNGDLIRDEKVAPYEWGLDSQNDTKLAGLTKGKYELRAVAQERGTGDQFETTVNFTVAGGGDGIGNLLPTISFSDPDNGQNFPSNADVYVKVDATDSDGDIEKVDLYLNGSFLRAEGRAPYEWGKANQSDDDLKNMANGTYTLRAVAFDNDGGTSETSLTFTVGDVDPDNVPPTANITAPANGMIFMVGDDATVSATASDNDGTVMGVELLVDGVSQGTDNSSPYSWVLTNLTEGSKTLEVIATDNLGATASASISITVEKADTGGGDDCNCDLIWEKNGSVAYYNDGRVGIGTSTPDEMLTVKGKIHAREVVVTVAAGADFVFEKDYELMPLAELATYLKANKHLPEIAPAAEMEAEGMEVSAFNIQLLQKIEELTLYTLQINAQNQTLQQSVELLKAQNELLKKELEILKGEVEK